MNGLVGIVFRPSANEFFYKFGWSQYRSNGPEIIPDLDERRFVSRMDVHDAICVAIYSPFLQTV